MPGKEWANGFLIRHKKKLALRLCQNIKRSRAMILRDLLKKYFDNLAISIDGIPPYNIFNYDKTNLTDKPDRKKVISPSIQKLVFEATFLRTKRTKLNQNLVYGFPDVRDVYEFNANQVVGRLEKLIPYAKGLFYLPNNIKFYLFNRLIILILFNNTYLVISLRCNNILLI